MTPTATAILRHANTQAGVEMTVVWGFVGIRCFDLIQAVVAMSTGSLLKSTAPGLDLAVFALMVVESLLLCSWLVRRRSVLPLRWPVLVDFAVVLLALGSALGYVAPDARTNVWAMWPYAVTLSTTVLIGGTLVRWQHAFLASTLLTATYVATVAMPLSGNSSGQATAIANSLAYPGFAIVAYLFISYIRRLACTADRAKRRVAELERDRSRAVVHDLLPYLRLDRFAEADLDTRLAMVSRAGRAYEHMRSFVDGTQNPLCVRDRLEAVVNLHPGLDMRVSIDLAPAVELPEDVLEHLHRALDTTLSNAEQHAPGAPVHLTTQLDAETVQVSVRDEGPGFDASRTRPGFGIAEVLGRQLAAVGGVSRVESAPGCGTEVHIAVPRDQ